MKELYTLGLSGILGLIFGALLKYKPLRNTVKIYTKQVPQPFSKQEIELDTNTFNPKEISFLQQLISVSNIEIKISSLDLIEILELQFLSNTARRIECNNFLKGLNLKILVKYGFKEAILIIGTDDDKRKKCYQLNSHYLQTLSAKKQPSQDPITNRL